MLKVEGLEKRYAHQTILAGCNLQVLPGESVSIIGPSGSGKSTLLRLLGLLETWDAGIYQLNNQPCPPVSAWPALRHRHFGYVFQSHCLLPYRTVLDNVLLPACYGAPQDVLARAHQLLIAVGLRDKAASYPNALSGGQQQRVAIARALLMQPKTLLADEPTAQLDDKTAQQMMTYLFELQAQHQLSLVLVTHETKWAQACDRQYYLEAGQLCAA